VSERSTAHAPRDDGAVVADPPLREIGSLLRANREHLPSSAELLGRSWADLRRQARRSAFDAACTYLAERGEPVPSGNPDGPFLLAGHQPELFHPGVWVKNFALQGLAQVHDGIALNMIVDNDTVKSTALRLPHPPDPDYPYLATVPFDRWTGETPYEEQTIQEPDLFAGFAEQAEAVLRPWGYRPLLGDFWAEVSRLARSNPHPGACFAGARRGLERSWGCHNLEAPLSSLCGTEPFAWFACHLLAELPRFHAVYNACVAAYRREHDIHSRNHPVPDLAAEDEWLEAPLWGWRTGQKRRGRLQARRHAGRLELRCGSEMWPGLPLSNLPGGFRELADKGYKVRSRALTTTIYARLFLADLFIHGIGGGKYDELTDAICRSFYGFEPPRYLVLSATRLLPLPTYPATIEDRRRLLRQVRDSRYNPERLPHDENDPIWRSLAAEKKTWIAFEPTTASERLQRYRTLRALNARLAELHNREAQLRRELADCEQQLAANDLLRRRDYAFCLYPEAVLKPFCQTFLRQAPGEE
jgi:hypothetical protein